MAEQEEQKQTTGPTIQPIRPLSPNPGQVIFSTLSDFNRELSIPQNQVVLAQAVQSQKFPVQQNQNPWEQLVQPAPPPTYSPPTPPQPQIPKMPDKLNRRQIMIGGVAAITTVLGLSAWLGVEAWETSGKAVTVVNKNESDQLVILWNNAILQALRELQPALPVAARALAIIHTCMFDAWAAYDAVAIGTQAGADLRRPANEQTASNKAQALSYAAYRALLDLFPTQQASLSQIMRRLGYNPADISTDTNKPAGVGNVAAQAVLDFRHNDGSNQLGDIHPGAYSNYTNYQPPNAPSKLNYWQPQPGQAFVGAQWEKVIPFALTSPTQFLPKPGPLRNPSTAYMAEVQQILHYSAGLTDEQKVIVEYWLNGPNSEEIPANWCQFAQFISKRDNHSLDQNVQLFFALANATLDASIACWTTKYTYSSSYPVTAIHTLFNNIEVQAWAGPGKGIQSIDGQYWLPYQAGGATMPAYPEYCSEQSVFSSAAADILRRFTGNDSLKTSYTKAAHTSVIEPGVPATNITLSWQTFSQAAEQASLAGRYSGIHFTQSDLDGRALGQQVATQAWFRALSYIDGHGPS
jgi:hypothetical protein